MDKVVRFIQEKIVDLLVNIYSDQVWAQFVWDKIKNNNFK